MFKSAFNSLLLLVSYLILLAPQAYAENEDIWRQSMVMAGEQLLLNNAPTILIEQNIRIDSSLSEVMNVLSDIQNYQQLYPQFDEITIHQQFQDDQLRLVSEFTAANVKQIGPFSVEELYFAVLTTDFNNKSYQLNIWQWDGLFVAVSVQLSEAQSEINISLVTEVFAPTEYLQEHALQEIKHPLIRVDFLKAMLEEGFIPNYGTCLSNPQDNHYCF